MSEAGEILGRLRLDASQFFAELDRAQARAEELNGADPKIRVTTEGAGKAVAELEAVKAAEDKVETGTRKVAAAQKDGAKQAVDWRGALVGSLVAVSAAAPPVAAAAVGITGAFGVMAGAGVLGVLGIVRGLKEGNAVGVQYKGTIDSLTASLHSAEDAAAGGLFPGVQASAQLLAREMPALNTEVGHFAGMLGAMLPTGLDATVTLLERANPLFDAAGRYLGGLVTDLDQWSHSNGYQDFLDYSIRSLPQVEKFLGDTGHLVVDFLTAWAPLGSDTLPLLDGLVTSVDDLVKRTGPLIPMTVAFVGAWKLLSPVAGMLSTIVGWTGKIGATAVTSAAEVDTLAAAEERAAAAGGGAGAAGGAAGLLGKAKGAIGAIGVAGGMALGDSYETSDISKQLLGQSSFTKGVAGRSGGADGMDAALSAMVKSGDAAKAAAQFGQVKTAADKLGLSTQQLAADFPRYTSASRTATTATQAAGTATSATVAKVDPLITAYNNLVTAANKAAAAEQAIGKTNQSLEGTTDSAKDAIANVSTALKANGASLDQNTAKGRANREVVLSAVQAITAHGDAINADGKHAAQARISNDQMAISLEKTMESFGVSKSAAEAYVNKLLGIPKNVSTEADLKAALALQHAEAAKKAAQDFARGDYKAALKADPSPANKAKADAMSKAEAFAKAQYEAKYAANPSNANKAAMEAAAKAHWFGNGYYMAYLRAHSNAAQVAGAAAASLNAVQSRTVYLNVVESLSGQVNAAQVAMNASRYGAHGGTAGSSNFGAVSPGMAYGGTAGFTVRGPGTAASDQAGTYRLANGEEVMSDLNGQASFWRPALKAMNARMSPAAVLQKVAKIAGQAGQSGPTTVITRNIEPHITIVHPTTQDAVDAARESAQYIQAFSGI